MVGVLATAATGPLYTIGWGGRWDAHDSFVLALFLLRADSHLLVQAGLLLPVMLPFVSCTCGIRTCSGGH